MTFKEKFRGARKMISAVAKTVGTPVSEAEIAFRANKCNACPLEDNGRCGHSWFSDGNLKLHKSSVDKLLKQDETHADEVLKEFTMDGKRFVRGCNCVLSFKQSLYFKPSELGQSGWDKPCVLGKWNYNGYTEQTVE